MNQWTQNCYSKKKVRGLGRSYRIFSKYINEQIDFLPVRNNKDSLWRKPLVTNYILKRVISLNGMTLFYYQDYIFFSVLVICIFTFILCSSFYTFYTFVMLTPAIYHN